MSDPQNRPARVGIIGGGLAGLAAAYDLGRAGYEVTVLEAAPELGGLASSIFIDGEPLERFYHFICRPDTDLIALVEELGIADRLHWRPTRTSFFYDGRMYQFGTPFDLIGFAPVPFWQRIRFGLNIIHSRYRRRWLELDRVPARQWLIEQIGEQAYNVIWHPLLKVKFGDFYDQISAAWIWHRVNRVVRSREHLWSKEHFGYLENGSATVVDALLEALRRMPGVTIRTAAPTERILMANGAVTDIQVRGDDAPLPCDHVVSTVPLPILLRMAPDLPADYRARLASIDYIGVVCMLLKLDRPVTDSFWVNINDPSISFNGFIAYSNLNAHRARLGGAIVYVPYYLATTEERYHYDDARLLAEYVAALRKINPAFDESWIREHHVFRTPHAQAICVTGFAEKVPAHQTPVRGLFITDSVQFYPEDRTISAAIRLGRRVAALIHEDETGVSARR